MPNPYVNQGPVPTAPAAGHVPSHDETAGIATASRPLYETLPSAGGPLPPAQRVRGAQYVIPDSARVGPNDPKSVVIRELSSDEILTCMRIAKGDRLLSGWEQAKLSIHLVDGRPVSHGDFEGDIYWQRWSSKVKSLILVAYADVNNTTDEEDKAFLASKKVV